MHQRLYNVQVRNPELNFTAPVVNIRVLIHSIIIFRIRRIKCDEAKPACIRCSSTGRKCDGYVQAESAKHEYQPLRTHHHTMVKRTAISDAPTILAATDFELRALQHFQSRTVPALSASFDSDFWDMVVLQVSGTQLPVRSAVIAFSSLHESYEKSNSYNHALPLPDDDSQVRSLKQYNIAVRQTAHLLNFEDPTSCRIALISCLLFVCLELIQDNYTSSINHLTGGLRLLSFCEDTRRRKAPLLPSLSILNDSLKQFFGRIIVQSMFLGDTHYDVELVPNLSNPETPTIFSTVIEARDMLDGLFLSTYRFLHLIAGIPDHSSGKLYQTQLLNELQEWNRLFREFIEAARGQFTQKDSTGVILLEIHYLSLSIMLDTALDKSKTFQRTPAPPFLRIISLVESLLLSQQDPFVPSSLGSRPPLTKLPRYSFDLGVIGPLFYTAVKCWNPLVRSKAISLLRHPNIPHREGMWSAAMTATLAQRITDVEEEILSTSSGTINPRHGDVIVDRGEGKVESENIKGDVWFDIERPTEDVKELKILVGTGPKKVKVSKEEAVTW